MSNIPQLHNSLHEETRPGSAEQAVNICPKITIPMLQSTPLALLYRVWSTSTRGAGKMLLEIPFLPSPAGRTMIKVQAALPLNNPPPCCWRRNSHCYTSKAKPFLPRPYQKDLSQVLCSTRLKAFCISTKAMPMCCCRSLLKEHCLGAFGRCRVMCHVCGLKNSMFSGHHEDGHWLTLS